MKDGGIVLCCVGCVSKAHVRLADASKELEKEEAFEIVSMTGTLCKDGVHIHISLSDEKGNTFGGHLMDGCIVNTTAEICIMELEDYILTREFDEKTGYKELKVTLKNEI